MQRKTEGKYLPSGAKYQFFLSGFKNMNHCWQVRTPDFTKRRAAKETLPSLQLCKINLYTLLKSVLFQPNPVSISTSSRLTVELNIANFNMSGIVHEHFPFVGYLPDRPVPHKILT